jgi:protein-tyrosine phosphatase
MATPGPGPGPGPGRGQSIPIKTVPNLRDLGGWSTPGGPVRSGLLYRSAEFADLAGPDLDRFNALGVRTVFDMRTDEERAQKPNALPAGVEYVVVDILKDRVGAAPAQLLAVLGDPAAAETMLGDGKAVKLFETGYREIVNLPSALAGYRTFFTDIARGEKLPAVFHCTTGKDRTGWGAAALLLLLGASYDDVLAEYLLTNTQLMPALQPVLDGFAAAGGDPALLMPVLGVQKEYLNEAIAEMITRYRDIDGYFTEGLGLDAGAISSLRSTMIASTPVTPSS